MELKNIDPQYLQSAINAAATRTYRIAARLGLSAAEREDMQQEILLDLLQRSPQYEAIRGSVNTFTGMVSEHRAVELLDGLMKRRKRMVSIEAANDSDYDEPDECAAPLLVDDRDLFAASNTLHDLEMALLHMSDEQVDLFHLLSTEQDLPSAARASGMSTATFYRRVADLQMHLRMFGIRPAA